jgi:tetratricopeptide (TPR) repeat protein
VALLRAKESAVLSYTRRFLPVASFLLLGVLGTTADTSEPKPIPKQIAQWVEQLGDNDFKVREDASKKLWEAGAAAEPALEKAIKSDDPEVARRARELLEKFHWGIYPDTPADIVALIRAYQTSGGSSRMDVLHQLFRHGEVGLRAVLKIAKAEKDEDQRKVLGDLVANKLPSAFLLAVTEGKYEPFERLLQAGHEGKFIDLHQYAAYWLLRGKLTERIEHFRAQLSEHPDDKWIAQTLAYLHRANGNLVEARKAAEKSGRGYPLVEGILFELGDWKSLTAKGTSHQSTAENPAEKWAYRAAFARLAGAHKEFEEAVRELRKCAEGKSERDSLAYVAAKGLLLNDRPAEGLELLRTIPERRELLFDILCARLEFTAAIDLATKEAIQDKELPSLDLARARLLCLLGDKEGEALFDRSAEHIKDGVDPKWVRTLLAEEMRAGLKDRAFAHAAKALSVLLPKKENQTPLRGRLYLTQLFPQQTMTAEVWWSVLNGRFKDESQAALLGRLRNLLEGKAAAKDVKTWIDADQIPQAAFPDVNVPLARLQATRSALAEGALLAGLDDLALSLLKKADSRDALLRLGDLLAAKKRWTEAAQSYQQAWKKVLNPEMLRERARFGASNGERSPDPLPLYLAGDALVRAGQENDGKKLIERAHWTPFADAETRYDFIRALTERGHKEAAGRETELLLRVSEPSTYYSGAAIRRLAVAALERKDYLKAAEGFEKSMLRCFHPYTNFVSNAAFANVPAQIHQLRASSLLAAGKLDEALRHMELALTDSPGYVDLPIALVPELERRGHKKEATDLFDRVYRAYEKVCREYPSCAWAHNSAAWLSACCRRNLDAALRHAEKAVELSPDHAGYFDTLAEVHFQRGDRDKAVAVQKRAIELEPKKAYYRKQLKRLEAGDPSSERPPENEE